MSLFYLLRHAQKERTPGDPSLTKIGIQQAKITARYFQNKNIQKVYVSPLNRTLQTASIIAQELNLKIAIDHRLRERMNWGDKENESFEQFMHEWTKTDLDRKYQPTHGDSSYNAGKRMESFIKEVSNIYDKNILVVTSGGVIGDLLRNIFSDKDLPLVTNRETKARYLEILECSITILKKEQNKFKLDQVGMISHIL